MEGSEEKMAKPFDEHLQSGHLYRITNDDSNALPVEAKQDITERKNAREEIRQQRDLAQTYLDIAGTMIVALDSTGKVVLINRKGSEILGWGKSSILGRNWFDTFIPPRHQQELKDAFTQILAGNIELAEHYENPVLTAQGEERIISWHTALIKDQNGNITSTLSSGQDITSRKKTERLLRESEAKYRQIAENMADVVWTSDLELNINYVSPSVEPMVGEPVQKHMARKIEEKLPPESLKAAFKVLNEELERENNPACNKDRSRIFEVEHYRADGSTFWVSMHVSFLRDEHGKPTGIQGITRDIDELQRARRKITQQAYEHEVVFNCAQSAMFLIEVRENGVFRYIRNNTARQQSTGLSLAQLEGKTPGEVFPAKMAEALSQKYQACVDARRPISYEETLELPVGTTIWRTRLSPVMSENGEVIYIVGSAEDITESKRAEEALKQAAANWRATFDSITDMIALVDVNRKIIRVNQAFVKAVGGTHEAINGSYCHEIVHGLAKPHPGCSLECALVNNKPCSLEIYEPKLDKHLECSALPLLNEQGETIGAVHILKDITERKKMEAEQQELRHRAEVSSRLAAIGEMAAGIAHEINNPLTGVIGFSELLSQEDLPPDLAQHVRYIIDGSNRVKDIVKRLLTFARQNKPFKTRTDIHELIDNTVAMRNYILEISNIEVVKEYELNLPWVTVDPGQIQQVFLNLIVNAEYAIKKAHDGGKLIIATRQEGSEITISFQDNGTGMDGETISSLFQPFFTTKEPGEGTGLGLALSHSIIQSHGGSIDVASKPGKGSTFTIRLPLVKSEPEPKPEPAVAVPASSPVTSGNILVVDDEASIRAFIKKVLHGQGYTVTVADTPYDALEKIKSNRYDAMLIDMRMPGMSGKELYEKMQSDIPSVSSRMIFITGDTSDLTTREFLKKESLHCVSKPFTKKELLATLNEVLTAKQ